MQGLYSNLPLLGKGYHVPWTEWLACGLQANWLRSVGIGKGDAVAIYMPMVCELPSKRQLMPPLPSFALLCLEYDLRPHICCWPTLCVKSGLRCAVAMLACARIGAVHSVVFGGFSAESLSQRMADAR